VRNTAPTRPARMAEAVSADAGVWKEF